MAWLGCHGRFLACVGADERAEQYVKDRVGWFEGTVGSEKHLGGYFK